MPLTGPLRRLSGSFETGWRSALREFAVIVAGVLAALAAQAWWERREDRERERDYLRQLLVDTRENERRLAGAIADDSAAGDAVGRAMAVVLATGPPPPSDSLLRWFIRAGASSEFRPLAGTYQALLGTGDLRLVRDDSLRALLASYATEVSSEVERQRQLRLPLQGTVGQMARAFPFMRGLFLDDVRPADLDVARLRADPDAAAVLFTLQASSVNRLSGLRRLRERTRELRRALEAAAR